jgi:hypothetical protein
MEACCRNVVAEFACRTFQAWYEFTGWEGIRVSSTGISARTRVLFPIQYINS